MAIETSDAEHTLNESISLYAVLVRHAMRKMIEADRLAGAAIFQPRENL